MSYNLESIREQISTSLKVTGMNPPDRVRDIAFHMTDWLEDMHRYHQFCSDPASYTSDEINGLLIAFLTHVPNHVAAASKLLLDVPVTDVFDVGSTSEG